MFHEEFVEKYCLFCTAIVCTHTCLVFMFLASPDAIEVMFVSDWPLADLTDVALVSDDTY